MKKVLLDTNAYTGLLGGDEKVLDVLAGADSVYLSVFVLGELYAGFKGGKKENANRNRLKNFLSRDTVNILLADAESAEIFAEVKNRLKTAGTPIPINDVWIASHVMQSGSFLVSYDRHFLNVQGLLLWPELQGG